MYAYDTGRRTRWATKGMRFRSMPMLLQLCRSCPREIHPWRPQMLEAWPGIFAMASQSPDCQYGGGQKKTYPTSVRFDDKPARNFQVARTVSWSIGCCSCDTSPSSWYWGESMFLLLRTYTRDGLVILYRSWKRPIAHIWDIDNRGALVVAIINSINISQESITILERPIEWD